MRFNPIPSWDFPGEGFALEEIIRRTSADRDAYYYGTHGGAELDLFIMRHGKRHGFEFKYTDAPSATKSMHAVMADLKLNQLWVIYPADRAYALGHRMQAVPLTQAPSIVKGLL